MPNPLDLLATRGLLPHGYCITWDPFLLWSMVGSDALIAAAYFSIPLTIFHFYRRRKDRSLRTISYLFSLFILLCGVTHVLDVWTVWDPVYNLQAATKVMTAAVSCFTAVALWKMMPHALRVPTVAQLSDVLENTRQEVERRKRVEHTLREAQVRLKAENELRLQAERALTQTQKLEALGRLTGSVAHDFNNLLAVVGNSVHVLRLKHPALAQTNTVAAIERAVATGAKLTRQLLAFSRRQPFRPRLVHLQRWLPEAQDLLRTSLGSRILLECVVEPGTDLIRVDPAELELALINSAVNARDAITSSGTGGRVRIVARNLPDSERLSTLAPGAFVEVRVIDDGPGIAPEVLKRLFEPFFTTKEPGQGTGLGLCQVYGLCTQAGGGAAMESLPGRGATLRLVFASAGQEEAPDPPAIDQPPAAGFDAKVLLVEDNEEVADATEALLAAFGLRVLKVTNAQAALEALARADHGFELVVSDVVMPGAMDGIAMAQFLRNSQPALPVLLMTGYSEHAASAMKAGLEILSKPASPASLHAVIAGLLTGPSGANRKAAT